MKRVYLTDKQAGSALLSSVMGAEITIARLKKKLKDREERIRVLVEQSGLIGWSPGAVEKCRRAGDLKIRNWKPKENR